MKITETRLDVLTRAISWLKFNETYIDVSAGFRWRNKEKLVWTVNWSALGAKTPAEAAEYAELIMKAARLATMLNELELVVENTDDARITSREEYEKAVMQMVEVIKNEQYNKLEELLK